MNIIWINIDAGVSDSKWPALRHFDGGFVSSQVNLDSSKKIKESLNNAFFRSISLVWMPVINGE